MPHENLYTPLYTDGKRDKARRYEHVETGKIISRREYIKRTEGVTPEEKAVKRYLKGKTPAGKTVERYFRKHGVQPPKPTKEDRQTRLPTTKMPLEKARGAYQIRGTYIYASSSLGMRTVETGYSRARSQKPTYGDALYYEMQEEAMNFGLARVRDQFGGISGSWEVVEIVSESVLEY